jgi:hypothetical protein
MRPDHDHSRRTDHVTQQAIDEAAGEELASPAPEHGGTRGGLGGCFAK